MSKPEIYYNPMQAALALSSIPFTVCITGRAAGKSTVLAEKILSLMRLMARAKVFLAGRTYYHLQTTTWSAIEKRLAEHGFIRGKNYVVWRRPPENWHGFQTPVDPPADYSRCVVFPNGFTVQLVSMRRSEDVRSASFDYGFVDEAHLLEESKLKEDLFPTLRGNRREFGHLREHHGWMLMANQPKRVDGRWLWEYEKLAKRDAAKPYDKRRFAFIEASSMVNREVLGDDWFEKELESIGMERYRIEVLNERPSRQKFGFYPRLDPDLVHGYRGHWNERLLEGVDLEKSAHHTDSRSDLDCDPDLPLGVSIDFGARFNCMSVHQQSGGVDACIRGIYVEPPAILDDLVAKFTTHYRFHGNKVVHLYGGSDGTKRRTNARTTLVEDVIAALKAAGWRVVVKVRGKEAFHADKFRFWQKFLDESGDRSPVFRINQVAAREVLTSMMGAATKADRIAKDKSSERKAGVPGWQATHFSDAVDNYYYWRHHSSLRSAGAFVPNSI